MRIMMQGGTEADAQAWQVNQITTRETWEQQPAPSEGEAAQGVWQQEEQVQG